MITLDKQKSQLLEFKELSIQGASAADLLPVLRIAVNGIEYGFKGVITESKISFNVPALGNINSNIVTGNYPARVDVMSKDGLFITAWQSDIVLQESFKVQMKLEPTITEQNDTTKRIHIAVAAPETSTEHTAAPVVNSFARLRGILDK